MAGPPREAGSASLEGPLLWSGGRRSEARGEEYRCVRRNPVWRMTRVYDRLCEHETVWVWSEWWGL